MSIDDFRKKYPGVVIYRNGDGNYSVVSKRHSFTATSVRQADKRLSMNYPEPKERPNYREILSRPRPIFN